MIAFSSVSMANTIELNSETKVEIARDYWDCAKIANDVYQELLEHFPEEEAMDNANAYFDHCMGRGSQSQPDCQPPFLC